MPRSNASQSRGRKILRAKSAKGETITRAPPDAVMRKTGIRVMGDAPWGTHICVFYETKEDLLDTCVTYFEPGLGSNEFCIWAVSDPITQEDAKDSLRRAIADFDRYMAAGQIEIVLGHEWYLKGNQFDLKRITGGWSEKLISALANPTRRPRRDIAHCSGLPRSSRFLRSVSQYSGPLLLPVGRPITKAILPIF